MELSAKGMLMIIHHEAIVLSRYKDSKGIWTIGVGFTHAALAGSKFDPEHFTGKMTFLEVVQTFKKLIKRYEDDCNEVLTREVPQHVFDSMVSFHWNTGKIKKASFVKLINEGASNEKIAEAFMKWNKPPEIIHRRRLTSHCLTHGDYGPTDVTIYNANSAGRIDWHHPNQVPKVQVAEMLDMLTGNNAIA